MPITVERAAVIHLAGRHRLSPAVRDGAPALVPATEPAGRCGWEPFFAALAARGLAVSFQPDEPASISFVPRGGGRAEAIHGNKSQNARERALASFKSGAIRALVATDIAARGIDVDGISHVINFDVPRDAEDYIHRVGRTSRAGASGDAVTFVSGEERAFLKKIETFTGTRIAVLLYPDYTPPASVMMEASRPAPYPAQRSGARPTRRPAQDQARRDERKPAPQQTRRDDEQSGPRETRWQEQKSAPHQPRRQEQKPAPYQGERPARRQPTGGPAKASPQKHASSEPASHDGNSRPFGGGRRGFGSAPGRKFHRRHLG